METVKIYPRYEGRLGKNHTILVQGVVDCIFHEDDGVVIVDYKSDRVKPGAEEEYAQRYKTQLELYSEAVSKLTETTVKGKYLYFLRTGRAMRIS
jgi:ATP-dependent helicase/nuclease subunit A